MGLRHARDVNLAFMSKLGWRLIHSRDDLWVNVLISHRHCGSNLLPRVNPSRHCSNVWKGICTAWTIVSKNLGWHIDNGLIARIWLDPWLPNHGPLIDQVTTDIPLHLKEVIVASYVMNDSWNWDMISDYLPLNICSLVAAMAPLSLVARDDSLV